MTLIAKIFHYSGLALSALLLPLILAIVISWNALPGNRFYPLKRGLENLAVSSVSFDFSAKSSLRSRFLDYRFGEMQRLLQKGSVEGIPEFLAEIETDKVSILDQSAANPQTAGKQAQQLKIQLDGYNQILALEKQSLASQPTEPSKTYPELEPTQLTAEPGLETTNLIIAINQIQHQIQKTASELD